MVAPMKLDPIHSCCCPTALLIEWDANMDT